MLVIVLQNLKVKCLGECEMDISIIIPLYKGNKYFQRIIEMLDRNMSYHNLFEECAVEIIFVNDYPEEQIEWINREWHYDVQVWEEPVHKGIHATRISGLKRAVGQFVIMLDQDDLVEDSWLYSQYNMIREGKADYCVCNCWNGRFKVMWTKDEFKDKVNDLNHYLTVGNAICSPGQVIIKKEAIPQEWINNIQLYNGADDFLLWIMAIKCGNRFLVNNEYLFYHTPDRTSDSVSMPESVLSLREAMGILDKTKFIDSYEKGLLENLIEVNIRDRHEKMHRKFHDMFHIMYRWKKLTNKGIGVGDYLKQKGYLKIALYGMGYIGECLYEELEKENINVLYGIDQKAVDHECKLPIYHIDDELEKVDIIILTMSDCGNVRKKIAEIGIHSYVKSLADILTDISIDI